MTSLDVFIGDLGDALPLSVGDAESGMRVGVTEISLELPIESRIDASGVAASTPRGRYATGFDVPHGRLRVRFVQGGEEEGEWPR